MNDVFSSVAPKVSILCTEGAQHISLGQRPRCLTFVARVGLFDAQTGRFGITIQETQLVASQSSFIATGARHPVCCRELLVPPGFRPQTSESLAPWVNHPLVAVFAYRIDDAEQQAIGNGNSA